MRNKITTLILLMSCSLVSMAQVGIGTNSPNANAALDVVSTTQGMLFPRMTTAQRDAISSPAKGLTIFNTTLNCLQTNIGTSGTPIWKCMKGISPVPGNITLSAIGPYFLASVYDQDYLPYTAPTVAASLATAQAANGTNESFTLNVQGSLTTAGVTLKIPYTVVTATVSLPAFSQTINVPASYTQDGIARDVTFSYGAASLAVGSGTINATLQAVGGTLNAKKLDIQTGIGNDYLGWLLAQFTYATSSSGGTANFDFRSIASRLGSTYTAYSNGSEVFSSNTTCTAKVISAQGCGGLTTVTGASSTVYDLVNINGQCWMKTNLKEVSTAPISDAPNTGRNVWTNTNKPDSGYWGYYNTTTTSGASGWATTVPATGEGLLYQWSAAMNNSTTERAQGVCPTGFHIPSDCEWMYLEHGQGMSIAQQTSNGAWRTTTGESSKLSTLTNYGTGTNTSGFTALLTGWRDPTTGGNFYGRGYDCGWWSSSEVGPTNARNRNLSYFSASVYRYNDPKAWGNSVRCLKD